MSELDRPEFQINARQTLENFGCILDGHFVGTSDNHLAGYCDTDPLLPHTNELNSLVKQMVDPFKDDGVETVVATPYGSVPFAHIGAMNLANESGRDVCGVFADKEVLSGKKTFNLDRRGFKEAVKGKKILILEDMINRMGSIRDMVNLVRTQGGIVVGVGSIAANNGVTAEAIGVPKLVVLSEVSYRTWTPEECMEEGFCSEGRPIIVDVGHGDAFRDKNPNYVGGYINL